MSLDLCRLPGQQDARTRVLPRPSSIDRRRSDAGRAASRAPPGRVRRRPVDKSLPADFRRASPGTTAIAFARRRLRPRLRTRPLCAAELRRRSRSSRRTAAPREGPCLQQDGISTSRRSCSCRRGGSGEPSDRGQAASERVEVGHRSDALAACANGRNGRTCALG